MVDDTAVEADGQPRMSRELVLDAALRIIDRDGVDGLSMRRLGHALGRDPMSLYRYAATKTALLDGVVELVLADLRVDTTASSPAISGPSPWPIRTSSRCS
jgi:AcrR family transcriptional regulator